MNTASPDTGAHAAHRSPTEPPAMTSRRLRRLGADGPALFPLGLGCMGMSEFYGPTDDAQSLGTLAAALDLGLQHFDTADTYGLGHNESLLGRFVAEGGPARRRRMVLATKFGIVREAGHDGRRIDNSPAYIRRACEASLQRLGVERIDLYYCHRRDPAVPIEDVVGTMARLVQEGKVAAIGLSEVTPATLRRAHALHPVAAVQSEYSLWTRDPEQGLLATCTELGTTLVAYCPLGRGFLTQALRTDTLASDDFRRGNPRFAAEAQARNQALVDAMAHMANGLGLQPAQLALAWLLNRHPQVMPIPGTRRIDRLRSNLAAADVVLDAATMAALETLFQPDAVAGGRYAEGGWLGVERA